MTITLHRSNPGAPDDALQAFEREIGAALPAPYRAFLAEHEGGRAEDNEFSIADANNSDSVQMYYTLNEIRKALATADFEETRDGKFPADLLPIACTDVGNLVCINTANGSVWFLDHELHLDDPEALIKLADTFGAFDELVQPFDINSIKLKPGQGRVVQLNVEWARANAHLFGDKFKAEHPEIFG